MIRNMLDPASEKENGMDLTTPTRRAAARWRDKEKGITRGLGSGSNGAKPPHWVRFIHEGMRFTLQHSADDVQWEAIPDLQVANKPASVEIPMNGMVHIGLAVASHNTTRAAEARISNVTVTGSVSPSGCFVHSKDITLEILPFSGKTTDK